MTLFQVTNVVLLTVVLTGRFMMGYGNFQEEENKEEILEESNFYFLALMSNFK